MKYLALNNGTSSKMPIVGLGLAVFPENPGVVEQTLETAIPIGYRLFDTAPLYRTETHLGTSLKRIMERDGLKREDIFISTKLPQTGMRPDLIDNFVSRSLKSLQMDYIDLYLIHWPIGMAFQGEEVILPMAADGKQYAYDMDTNLEGIWKAMEQQVIAGKLKAIGLSNFNVAQIKRIIKVATILPANLQIEFHAYIQEKELREFCKQYGITITAYYPLGGQSRNNYPDGWRLTEAVPLLDDPVVKDLAAKYNKTTAQILLRFVTQLGVAVIPKSSNPQRLLENFNILDFELAPEDMMRLEALDKGEIGRSCFGLPGCEKHPEYPFTTTEQTIFKQP